MTTPAGSPPSPVDDPTGATVEGKQRFSTQISAVTAARARATVRAMQGVSGRDYRLSELVEHALNSYCLELECQHNGGERWPGDDRPLRAGRPRGRADRP